MRSVRYKTIRVKDDKEKPTICLCCGKKPKPRGMHLHHTKYEYSTKEVKENPQLGFKNTIPLCYSCHRIANCLRILEENPQKTKKLIKLCNFKVI